MRKLIFLLLSVISISAFSQTPHTDAYLENRLDSLIRGRTFQSTPSANQTQLLIDSKVSILSPKLTNSSTSGYVWTATGTSGLGSWQVASGGGLTNGAANNELMKSNGTNAIASGLFSTTAGDVTLGTGLSGGSRTLLSDGSASNVSLNLYTKGSGDIILRTGTTSPVLIYNNQGFTNSVSFPLKLQVAAISAPSAGIGVGLEFSTTTDHTGPNREVGSTISSVTTDVTGSSEDFDLVLKTMSAGAAAEEHVRINEAVVFTLGTTAATNRVQTYFSGDGGIYKIKMDAGSEGSSSLLGANGISGNTSGDDVSLIGGNAFAASNDNGGDVILTPGIGDGSGIDGKIGLNKASPTSTIHMSGSVAASYVAKTTTYTLDETDYVVDCTSGSFTTTLPTAVGITGRIYIIKNSGAGLITLATTSSQTIDGTTPGALTAGLSIQLMSTGANWITIK